MFACLAGPAQHSSGRAGHRTASLGRGQPPPGKAAPPSTRAHSRSPAPSVTSFPGPSAPTRAVCSASSTGRLHLDSPQPSSLLHQPACDCKPSPVLLQRAVVLSSRATAAAKPVVRHPAPHYHLAKLHRACTSRSWGPGAPLPTAGAFPAQPCLLCSGTRGSLPALHTHRGPLGYNCHYCLCNSATP